jgi:hypothetical protein
VLPAGNGRNIVIWRACVESREPRHGVRRIAKHARRLRRRNQILPSEFPGSLVGPAIDPRQALFVVGISPADDCVWRNSRRRVQLHVNSRCGIQTGEIVRRRGDRGRDIAQRTGDEINLAV